MPREEEQQEREGLPERWSAQAKVEVVLRLLKGEDLGEVSWEIRVPPPELADAVRGTLNELDPLLPMTRVRTMEDVLGSSMAHSRFSTLLLSGFAGLALLLP